MHDWSTAVGVLCTALDKLSTWSAHTSVSYRTIDETAAPLPPACVPGSAAWRAQSSWLEKGFLTATRDKQVALGACADYAKASVLQLHAGDASLRGVDVSWLSQYPHEMETIFPPCNLVDESNSRTAASPPV